MAYNFNRFKEALKCELLIDEPMSSHTSFRIGGKADLLVLPTTVSEVKSAIAICREEQLPFYVIGNGSNLLVRDGGFRGVIVKLFKNFSKIESVDETTFSCQSGALLSAISAFALDKSLTGLEFAAGIPGTVGGAVCMNAGAYDGEIKDVLVSADVINGEGEVLTLSNEQLQLSYRTSAVQISGYVVLSAVFSLNKGEYSEIKEKIGTLNKSRREKQPVELPSAGSAFKRPKGNFAGKLITESGLKGCRVGGASVSVKHAGFIVNDKGASAADVIKLIEHVKNVVNEKFGVMLEPEVKIIGE